MKLRDRIRAEGVVQRLSWRLGWAYVPARQQREIVRELRVGLEEAASSGDLDEAIERLGSTRELAREYADVLQPRVRWLAGLMWAAIAFATVVWIGIIAALAFAAGLDAAAVAQGSYDLWPSLTFGDEAFIVEQRDAQGDVTGVSMSLLTPVHLVAMLVACVVGSRLWRLLRRER